MGLPRLALEQNYFHNKASHRRFGPLRQRLLLHHEFRLDSINNQIDQLDKADEAANNGRLHSLSSVQIRGGGGGSADVNSTDQVSMIDALVDEATVRMDKYTRMLHQDYFIRHKLPRISREEHENLFLNIKTNNTLDEEARNYLYYPDDFITTRTERIYSPIESLIFGEGNRLQRLAMKLFLTRTKPEGSTHTSHYSASRLKLLLTLPVVAVPLVLLLSPVGILYLGDLSKGWSALVVLIFGLVFTTAMTQVPAITLDTILVGLAAYMAVLVTFLANISG
ncbi:hypothetical protein B0T17DRAFT_39984 [Bombardia bombarda]|uniref:DUF6594 domain-containing protein n=1 Tax=Bombardia bombarda TaxID=252184 RepID=A0AA39XK47_9PEZI|nr:hypothetical protein B0T17DRAFT_39984 [Bombardia bombarda]